MGQFSGLALRIGWSHAASESGRDLRIGWVSRCVNAFREVTASLARERARRDLMALDAHLRRDLGLSPFGPDMRSVGPFSLDDRIELRS